MILVSKDILYGDASREASESKRIRQWPKVLPAGHILFLQQEQYKINNSSIANSRVLTSIAFILHTGCRYWTPLSLHCCIVSICEKSLDTIHNYSWRIYKWNKILKCIIFYSANIILSPYRELYIILSFSLNRASKYFS